MIEINTCFTIHASSSVPFVHHVTQVPFLFLLPPLSPTLSLFHSSPPPYTHCLCHWHKSFLGLLYRVLGMMSLMALFNAAKERISVTDDADEEFSPPLPDNEESTTTTRKRYVFRYTLKQALHENWLNLFQP